MKAIWKRMRRWALHRPLETCAEYFAVEEAVARQQWEYVRGLDYVPPTQEEIDDVIRNMAKKKHTAQHPSGCCAVCGT